MSHETQPCATCGEETENDGVFTCDACTEAVITDDFEARIRAEERASCIEIIRRYLAFDDQRAVSWHEVQDACEAIRARGGK